MTRIIGIVLFFLTIATISAIMLNTEASNTTGVVNFNVKPLDIPDPEKHQEVSIFGCNNVSKTIKNLEWGKQYSRELTYGWQEDKSFYVAQYYLASPPVPIPSKPDEKTTLGLLYQDHFRFEGVEPSVEVTLDYNQLMPVYLSYIDIDYGNCQGKVDQIPINTICPQFPYKNGEHKLASGIGLLANKKDQRRIFLPTLDVAGKNPLQCSASILNDIQLDYRISFSIGELIIDELDLTQQLLNPSSIPLKLFCEKRPDTEPLPSGCTP